MFEQRDQDVSMKYEEAKRMKQPELETNASNASQQIQTRKKASGSPDREIKMPTQKARRNPHPA